MYEFQLHNGRGEQSMTITELLVIDFYSKIDIKQNSIALFIILKKKKNVLLVPMKMHCKKFKCMFICGRPRQRSLSA